MNCRSDSSSSRSALFSAAVINLFTKETATISGLHLHDGIFRGVRGVRAHHSQAARGRQGEARSVPAEHGDGGRGRHASLQARRRARARARLQHARAARLGRGAYAGRAGRRRPDGAPCARTRRRRPRIPCGGIVHRLRADAVHEGGRDRGTPRQKRQASGLACYEHLRRCCTDRGEAADRGSGGGRIGNALRKRSGAFDGRRLGPRAARAIRRDDLRDFLGERGSQAIFARCARAAAAATGRRAHPPAVGEGGEGDRAVGAPSRHRGGGARQSGRGPRRRPQGAGPRASEASSRAWRQDSGTAGRET